MVKKVSLSDETIELLNNQGEGLSYDQIIQKGVKAVEPELQEQKKKQQEEKEAKAKLAHV